MRLFMSILFIGFFLFTKAQPAFNDKNVFEITISNNNNFTDFLELMLMLLVLLMFNFLSLMEKQQKQLFLMRIRKLN